MNATLHPWRDMAPRRFLEFSRSLLPLNYVTLTHIFPLAVFGEWSNLLLCGNIFGMYNISHFFKSKRLFSPRALKSTDEGIEGLCALAKVKGTKKSPSGIHDGGGSQRPAARRKARGSREYPCRCEVHKYVSRLGPLNFFLRNNNESKNVH